MHYCILLKFLCIFKTIFNDRSFDGNDYVICQSEIKMLLKKHSNISVGKSKQNKHRKLIRLFCYA